MKKERPHSLERNVTVFTVRNFLRGIYTQMLRVIYQPFILSLNPSMTLLGLLEGLGGFHGILGALVNPLFGWLSDRANRKPFIVLGSVLMASSTGFFLLSGITKTFVFVIPAFILTGISFLDMPIVNALVAESVEPSERGRAYSRITLAWMAPGIFSPLIGGFIADRFGFLEVFAIGTIIQCVIILLLTRYLREKTVPHRSISLSELASFLKRNLAPPKTLRNIYIMNILDALTIGMGYVLFIGILRAHFNFSSLQLGIITVFEALVAAIIQVFVGRMIEKYGCKRLLFSSYLAFLIYLAGIALSKSYVPILLLQIFWGIALATWASPHQTLMANSTTQAERAEAMGRINLYKGMFGFLAPFLGGFLYEQYGYSAPLWASFICGLIVTVFIHFFIRVENDRLM